MFTYSVFAPSSLWCEDNAPHLLQHTASCLISQADKKIKTTSSVSNAPSLVSSVFVSQSRRNCMFFFSTGTTNQIPVIHFSVPVASLLLKLKSSITQHFLTRSLRDGLMRRQHQVIQQLSRGNPLDCTLAPDNAWKCPLASSKLTHLLGVVLGWFPTCLHWLWNYSRSGSSRFTVCEKK